MMSMELIIRMIGDTVNVLIQFALGTIGMREEILKFPKPEA